MGSVAEMHRKKFGFSFFAYTSENLLKYSQDSLNQLDSLTTDLAALATSNLANQE
jgi:hypothetical protein